MQTQGHRVGWRATAGLAFVSNTTLLPSPPFLAKIGIGIPLLWE